MKVVVVGTHLVLPEGLCDALTRQAHDEGFVDVSEMVTSWFDSGLLSAASALVVRGQPPSPLRP